MRTSGKPKHVKLALTSAAFVGSRDVTVALTAGIFIWTPLDPFHVGFVGVCLAAAAGLLSSFDRIPISNPQSLPSSSSKW